MEGPVGMQALGAVVQADTGVRILVSVVLRTNHVEGPVGMQALGAVVQVVGPD